MPTPLDPHPSRGTAFSTAWDASSQASTAAQSAASAVSSISVAVADSDGASSSLSGATQQTAALAAAPRNSAMSPSVCPKARRAFVKRSTDAKTTWRLSDRPRRTKRSSRIVNWRPCGVFRRRATTEPRTCSAAWSSVDASSTSRSRPRAAMRLSTVRWRP